MCVYFFHLSLFWVALIFLIFLLLICPKFTFAVRSFLIRDRKHDIYCLTKISMLVTYSIFLTCILSILECCHVISEPIYDWEILKQNSECWDSVYTASPHIFKRLWSTDTFPTCLVFCIQFCQLHVTLEDRLTKGGKRKNNFLWEQLI